ncbi:MAG TPA: CDP-alcohol phosphatidyltransferase family protein [Gaiellaceae bacterium]|nr:CDP-alcohol phosphatidyltransferase family protein [Gaiellaceae bacterium]
MAERGTSPSWARAALCRAADLLRLLRLVAAPALAAVLAAGRLVIAAALLAGTWLTDALDGQAARASGIPTHLGRFDLVVDTAWGPRARRPHRRRSNPRTF